MSIQLKRRAVLRGIAGAALALPTLDAMLNHNGTAYADGTALPKRYLVAFGGHSLGFGYNDTTKPECLRPGVPRDMFVPDTAPTYDPTTKLAISPLAPVKNDVSVVSGLRIPWASSGGETAPAPAGGVPQAFHYYNMGPLLTGNRSKGIAPYGPSSDQVVADHIAGDTIFKSLSYKVQAAAYVYENAQGGGISYMANGDPKPAFTSPAAAYRSLFDRLAPTDPAQIKVRERYMRERKSVLDLVGGSSAELMPKLGRADRQRLERHFDEIRELEKRMATSKAASDLCKALAIPTDPPIGGVVFTREQVSQDPAQNGWSDEETRARLFCDLVQMAFACDLTRSISLMFTDEQCFMSVYHVMGVRADVHALSHFGANAGDDSGSTEKMSLSIRWHIKHFAYLVDKMKDMMADTAMVYLCSGGAGPMPDNPGGQPGPHSLENMAALIAGRAGGLKGGQHVIATGKHPANVLISGMRAVGVPQTTLGEVSGHIPELFV